MPAGWPGERVRLVPLDKARHLDNALLWLNDPELTQWTLVGDLPLCRLAEEDFFDRACRAAADADALSLAIETLGGEHIGYSSLHKIDWRSGVATSGTLVGRRDLWGQGYGTDAARVRLRYAFDVLGLRLLLSEVMDGNDTTGNAAPGATPSCSPSSARRRAAKAAEATRAVAHHLGTGLRAR
jgi:RimJ/RimL family protein N-acetyltransferase